MAHDPAAKPIRRWLIQGAALLALAAGGGGASLAPPAGLRVTPLCPAQATARPTWGGIPGFYDVTFRTVDGCPPGGLAWVRVESGRVYGWRPVRPGGAVVFRGVPWYWRASWRGASGRAYPVSVPELLPPRFGGGGV